MTTTPPAPVRPAVDVPAVLERHLRRWLGDWPAAGEVAVATSASRVDPGWDGSVVPVVGLDAVDRAVVSVPPDVLADAPPTRSLDEVEAWLRAHLGRDRGFGRVVYRWQSSHDAIPELGVVGEWCSSDDPGVPEWLRPFNGGVLVARRDGANAAGVGIKRHDDDGWELAVVTEPAFRGLGLGRALVAQAARWTIEQGAVPLYLHREDNVASAALAAGAGFPDLGWRLLAA